MSIALGLVGWALVACSDRGGSSSVVLNRPPTFDFLAPLDPVTVARGGQLQVRFEVADLDNDPLELAFELDGDGDLATVADRISFASNDIPGGAGPINPVPGPSFEAVPEGTYRLGAVVADAGTPGGVRVWAPSQIEVVNAAWARGAGEIGNEGATAATRLPNGTTVVGGFCGASLTLGSVVLQNPQGGLFFAGYAPDGAVLWAQSDGGPGFENVVDLASDRGGFFTAVGSFENSVTLGTGQAGGSITLVGAGRTGFLARYDRLGMLDWAQALPPNVSGVAVSEDDGSICVTGMFSGTAGFAAGTAQFTSRTAVGASDLFVARYTSAGRLEWVRQVGDGDAVAAASVRMDASGVAWVGGGFSGTATFGRGEPASTILTHLGEDAFLARYSSSGLLIAASSLTDSSQVVLTDLAVRADGRSVAVGSYQGTARFLTTTASQSITLTATGQTELFVVGLDSDGAVDFVTGTLGTDRVSPSSIEWLADDSFLVAGAFNGELQFGGRAPIRLRSATQSRDAFWACYSATGTLARWAGQASGEGNGATTALAPLPDGSCIITGVFQTALRFGAGDMRETLLSGAGVDDVFVARINGDGRF